MREMIQFINGATYQQFKMKYHVLKQNKGQILALKRTQNGKDKTFLLRISEIGNKEFTSCSNIRRSTTGRSIFLESTLVLCISKYYQ